MHVIDHLSPIEVEDMEVPPRPQDPLDLGSRPHLIGEVRPGREADHPIDTRSPERDRDDIGMDPLAPAHSGPFRHRPAEHPPEVTIPDAPPLPHRTKAGGGRLGPEGHPPELQYLAQ